MEKPVSQEEGFVSALYISRAKGEPREQIRQGRFLAGHGLEGDAWSGPGDRQVVILTRRARLDVEEDIRHGLCYPRFKETLQLDGLPAAAFPVGERFRAGEALLEVAARGKRCFAECEIVLAGAVCSMRKNAVFARVLETGVIAVGDAVVLE